MNKDIDALDALDRIMKQTEELLLEDVISESFNKSDVDKDGFIE